MRLAAIDIGSNAARLLISEVLMGDDGEPVFSKLNLCRVPLRLGVDVFSIGEISKPRIGMVLQTMKAYKHLMNAYGVDYMIACATSAMRDAKNAPDLIRKIKMETGIEIQVISGSDEAAFIYESHIAEHMDKNGQFLYIDVGGGSTELTYFNKGKMAFKQSFNIGTIRLLKEQITDADWEVMKDTVKKQLKPNGKIITIGSGGNINKIFSLSKLKDGKPLSLNHLREYYREFSNFTVHQMQLRYGMREDRADVIVHALRIYINVMRWAESEVIYVPKIGLADGLIQHLYAEVIG
ncbi:MAG: exopolyphosphatase [Chitinophagaceae bacterium]|nr:exopolyphosphatase [Chitinophagaceae bacterium]